MVTALWIDDGSGPEINPILTEEEVNAALGQLKQDNITALWRAATDYQESFISGAAIGLLAMGVMQQKPKAMAVMGWINSIWNNEYYPRKERVTYLRNESLCDFSVCGAMPYSVPEISAEILGG